MTREAKRTAAAYITDRKYQWTEDSGIFAALGEIAAAIERGEHLEAAADGSLDDLMRRGAEFDHVARVLATLRDYLMHAAPLAWAAHGDMASAAAFERGAEYLIGLATRALEPVEVNMPNVVHQRDDTPGARLAKACLQRRVDEQWPALAPLIARVLAGE